MIECDVEVRGFSDAYLRVYYDGVHHTCTDSDADSTLCDFDQADVSVHAVLVSSVVTD